MNWQNSDRAKLKKLLHSPWLSFLIAHTLFGWDLLYVLHSVFSPQWLLLHFVLQYIVLEMWRNKEWKEWGGLSISWTGCVSPHELHRSQDIILLSNYLYALVESVFAFGLFNACWCIADDSIWMHIDRNTVAGVIILWSLSYFGIIT